MGFPSKNPVRVLIVDDSAVVRAALAQMLSNERDIEVVATATDPFDARDKVVDLDPDVIVLDVQMPRMDGLTFLHKIMSRRPTPVIMCSTLTNEGARVTMKAMEAGAVDFVAKPNALRPFDMKDVALQLADKIRAAAQIPDIRRYYLRQQAALRLRQKIPRLDALMGQPSFAIGNSAKGGLTPPPAPAVLNRTIPASSVTRVIAVGASTGGTEALREVLSRLPKWTPGIVIVQHMPEHFTKAFADRMNDLCQIEVREAADGDAVKPGLALIAPGNRHMALRRGAAGYVIRISDGELVCRHRPSVEVLFQSVARQAGARAIGVMLTGMGGDGAQAMRAMKDAGAFNIAQDEASCVVFGMPREAIRAGAVDRVCPLDKIAEAIFDRLTA